MGSPGWWRHGPHCSKGVNACTEPAAYPGHCVPMAPCSRLEEYLVWGPAGGGGRDPHPRPGDAPGTFCFSVPTTQSRSTVAGVLEGHSRSPGEFALRWPLRPCRVFVSRDKWIQTEQSSTVKGRTGRASLTRRGLGGMCMGPNGCPFLLPCLVVTVVGRLSNFIRARGDLGRGWAGSAELVPEQGRGKQHEL